MSPDSPICTNNFAVSDIAQLVAALAPHNVAVHRQRDARVRLSSADRWTEAVVDAVGALLQPGSVALFMHVDAASAGGAYAYVATSTLTVDVLAPAG